MSVFELMDSLTRVDAAATLTSNIAPSAGTLTSLQDGSLATTAVWPTSSGLVLHWDFGAPVSVMDIRLGAADAVGYFPVTVNLEWSDDNAAWTTHDGFAGIVWPGPRTRTSSRHMPCVLWSERCRTSDTTLDSTRKLLTVSASVKGAQGEIGVTTGSGKHQFEVIFGGASPSTIMIGVGYRKLPPELYPGADTGGWGYYNSIPAQRYTQGSSSAYGATYSAGDVIGVVFEDGSLTFYKNGVSQGVAATGITSQVVYPWAGTTNSSTVTAEMVATLQYPVSGAVPWGQPVPYRILTSIASRTDVGGMISIPTAGQIAIYGTTAVAGPVLGRGDYTNPHLGKGIGRIFGTTKIDGTPDAPVSRRVRLLRDHDGMLIRETWSNPLTGAYEFLWLDEAHTYTALAYDHTENYRAVVADRIIPDLIP